VFKAQKYKRNVHMKTFKVEEQLDDPLKDKDSNNKSNILFIL